MRNFVLIGAAGYIAPKHMQAIKSVGGNLIAALDPHDSVGVLDQYFPDCQFFTEFERFDRFCSKFVSSGKHIDYVSICSPNYLHDAHCRFAFRIDADAICEKPLAIKSKNVEEIIHLEDQTGHKAFCILQLRLNPALQRLKAQIAKNPQNYQHVIIQYNTPRGDWYRYSWKSNIEKSGGMITNIGIHLIDMLLWLFENCDCRVGNVLEYNYGQFLNGDIVFTRNPIGITHEASFRLSIEKHKQPTRLLITKDEQIELSKGFTDSHIKSYEKIIEGTGFTAEDTIKAIQLCEMIKENGRELNNVYP